MLIRPPRPDQVRLLPRSLRPVIIVGLAAAALAVLAMVLGRAAPRPRRMSPAPPRARESLRPASPDGLAVDREPTPRALALAEAVDGARLARVLWTPPFSKLLDEVSGLPEDRIRGRVKTDVPIPFLLEQAADYRGEYVRARGVLVRLDEMDRPSGSGPPVFLGEMLDLHGITVVFVVTDTPSAELPRGTVAAERQVGVSVDGAFLQVALVPSPTGPGRPAPLVIGRRLEPARVLPPAEGLVPKALSEREYLLHRVQDQRPLAIKEQKAAYYYLLEEAHGLSDGALAERVELGVRYEHFVDAPHAVRGAYVRLHGSLLRLEETEMDAAKCGLPRVWEGQILDMEHRPVSFILTEDPRPTFEPDKVTIHTGGAVTLQGVFLMNCAYEDRTGGHTATPLIIARRLARRPAPAHGGTSSALRLLLTGLAGVGAASVAVMVWVLARRRPAPRTRASAGDADPGEMNETPMRQDPAVFDPADYLDANEPSDESQVG